MHFSSATAAGGFAFAASITVAACSYGKSNKPTTHRPAPWGGAFAVDEALAPPFPK
jgi:hypothetical protein